MTRGRGFGLGTIAGCVLAVSVTGAAWGCTPNDYMTPEQLASGLYDTTPPAWETESAAGSATPDAATAAGTSAPTGSAEPAPTPAPADRSGAAPQVTASKPQPRQVKAAGKLVKSPAPRQAAPKPAAAPAAPAPVAPAPQLAPTPTPDPATSALVTAEPKADASRTRSARVPPARRTNTKPQRIVRMQMARPAIQSAHAPTALDHGQRSPVAGRVTAPRDAAQLWTLVAMLLGGLGGIAGIAAVLRRRGGSAAAPTTVGPTALPDRDAEMEAALQELLAEERARALTADCVAPRH